MLIIIILKLKVDPKNIGKLVSYSDGRLGIIVGIFKGGKTYLISKYSRGEFQMPEPVRTFVYRIQTYDLSEFETALAEFKKKMNGE